MTKKKNGGIVAELSIGKPGKEGGIPVYEFVALTKIITDRHGKAITISATDKNGHIHLRLKKKHLGFIDIKNGSLVWDGTVL